MQDRPTTTEPSFFGLKKRSAPPEPRGDMISSFRKLYMEEHNQGSASTTQPTTTVQPKR